MSPERRRPTAGSTAGSSATTVVLYEIANRAPTLYTGASSYTS